MSQKYTTHKHRNNSTHVSYLAYDIAHDAEHVHQGHLSHWVVGQEPRHLK